MIEFKELLPEVNIGLVGHVDHGKTTLVHTLTGKWADTHSEEIKRGITIRIGYANAVFYKCEKCGAYGVAPKCQKCFESTIALRAVSFVDLPGHETLMATVLSGAALMDGALLLIAANEKCPQPQTAEHLKALEISRIKNIVVVHSKIDLVTTERAIESYNEIKNFAKGTIIENSPIIPISALHNANIDLLIEAIENHIPTPKRDLTKEPRFVIARSFDVNKPGTDIKKIHGGIIGGSVIRGKFSISDEIEIKPGVKTKESWKQVETKIKGIVQKSTTLKEATPGGLVAIETTLDPYLTKGDNLAGNIAGLKGELPESSTHITATVTLFDHVIGVEGEQKVSEIKTGDMLMVTSNVMKSLGVVKSSTKERIEIELKIPLCVEEKNKIAISKQISGRWHLIGWGTITQF